MVNLIIDDIHGLLQDLLNKKLVCYGAGGNFDEVMNKYENYSLADKVVQIIDDDKNLYGTVKYYKEKEYPITSLNKFIRYLDENNVVIVVTNYNYFMEIICELDKYTKLAGIHVYVGDFLHIKYSCSNQRIIRKMTTLKIPKVIHYCWFGGKALPPEYRKYMDSWKKHCPDYQIIRWDESNYDVTKNKYMYEAYQEKKWAFVSDYARVDIINTYGGIYLDCDVELLKSWNPLLGDGFFAGFEDYDHIALGLGFGARKNHEYLEKLLELYERIAFRTDEGLNMVACPKYQSEIINEMGFNLNNTFQKKGDMVIYPSNIFAPVSFWGMGQVDESSYSVHHYKATWHTDLERKYIGERQQRGKMLYQRYMLNE